MSARAAAAKVRTSRPAGRRAGRWGAAGEASLRPPRGRQPGATGGRGGKAGGRAGGAPAAQAGARLPVPGSGSRWEATCNRSRAWKVATGEDSPVPGACPQRPGGVTCSKRVGSPGCLWRSGWYPAKPYSFDLMSPAAVCAVAARKLGDSKTLSSRAARVYFEVYYLCEVTEGGKFLAV